MAIEYKGIGRHIRAARKQKKMTQEAVAEALGVSLNHFGKVERGDRPINLQQLSQLSLLLEIPLGTLVEGSMIADDGIAIQNANTAEAFDVLDSTESLTKGCSEGALRLCADLTGVLSSPGRSTWQPRTILSILTNEKYKGGALLQKTFCTDFLTKKMKVNEGEVPQYYVENSHPAIVSDEVYEEVQMEMARRRKLGRQHNSQHCFSGRIYYGCCERDESRDWRELWSEQTAG